MPVDGRTDGSGAATGEKDERGIPGWIFLALLGLSIVWSTAQARSPVQEPDVWWHLALGEQFRNGGSLSHPDALTPFASQTWVPTQWLFEVVASRLVDWWGAAAVPWLASAGVASFAVALFASCRRSAGTIPAVVATLAAFTAVSVFFVPRPQLVSFVLLSVFVAAWLETARDLRPRWWLVAVSYVWANAHGLWVLGPLLGLLVTLGLVLDRRLSPAQAARLLSIPLLGVVVAALTPVGPRLLLGPMNVGRISSLVAEWQPPNFREPYAALAALLVFVVVVTWSRSSVPKPWSHVLLLGLAGAMTLHSARTVPLGVILAAPLVAAAMSSWMSEPEPRSGAWRDIAWVAALAGLALVLVTLFVHPRPPAESMVGDAVDTRLDELPEGSVVFNEYAFGGWLDWRHRQVVPVIDGLTESYSADYITAHGRSLAVLSGWQGLLRETGATYALLDEQTPLMRELGRRGWSVEAEGVSPFGDTVVLLQAPAG